MILIGNIDNSINYSRPAPVFTQEQRPLSTKKSRGTPKFAAPPKAPVKSCPVTRVFSRISPTDQRPQPVSFRDDSDTSFISQSSVYSAKKPALYFEQVYDIEETLGCGCFGEVFGVRSKEDGQLYACKRTLLKFRGQADRLRRISEVEKHETLPKHKNLVKFYRAWEERQQLYLLTELCHQSLTQYTQSTDIPEYLIWHYIIDLLQAISHLHKNNLIHMDVKPDNIFFGYDGLCKLGDFGLMIDLGRAKRDEATEGDPKYLAPEVMQGVIGPPADIFSLGLTILELATDLDLPKQGRPWQQLRQGVLPHAAGALSPELQGLLQGLLNPEPQLRLTADQALNLPKIRRLRRYKDLKYHVQMRIEGVKGRAKRASKAVWGYLRVFVVFLASLLNSLASLASGAGLARFARTKPQKSCDSDGFSDEENLCDLNIVNSDLDCSRFARKDHGGDLDCSRLARNDLVNRSRFTRFSSDLKGDLGNLTDLAHPLADLSDLNCDLKTSDLSDSNCDLNRSDLGDLKCDLGDLRNSHLNRSDLNRSDLRNSDLSDLNRSDLGDLRNSDLNRSDLNRDIGDLRDLRNSDLNRSDLNYDLNRSDLGDLRTSHLSHKIANSTPISYKYPSVQSFQSPVIHSDCFMTDSDSPYLFRRRTGIQTEKQTNRHTDKLKGDNVKGDNLKGDLSFNMTSKNLIDLFNAAESDSD